VTSVDETISTLEEVRGGRPITNPRRQSTRRAL
jgi:hypothetical protein